MLIPKDPRIMSILERLERERIAITSNKLAEQFSRYKQVRNLRELKQLNIGNDRRTRESIIFCKKQIRRKGKGFIL